MRMSRQHPTVVFRWGSTYFFNSPNPVIFKTALEKAGCYAYEAFMIGDRIDNDIAPAKSLGINTVWIRQGYGGLQSPEKFGCIPDFIVNSLNELLDIL